MRYNNLGGDIVSIRYRIDVLAELKSAGYNTGRIRKDKLLSEGTLQLIREGKIVNAANLAKICKLLNCQPGHIIEYSEDESKM